MLEKYKTVLDKQLDLLSEQSHTCDNRQDIAVLTEAMAKIVPILCQLSQSQFYAEGIWSHPYVGSLSMKDLIDLAKVRADRVHSLDDDLKKRGVVIRKET